MITARQFSRAAPLLQLHWSKLSPQSAGVWRLAEPTGRFDCQDPPYLVMEGVPKEHLSSLTSSCQPGGTTAGASRSNQISNQISHVADQTDAQPSPSGHASAVSPVSSITEVEEQDPCSLAPATPVAAGGPSHADCTPHVYDIHVVYHPSYSVPALFFRGKHPDGTPLGWEDMCADFPHWRTMQDAAPSPHMFITPEAHPILQQSWYLLHPCRTSHLLQLMLERQQAQQQQQQQGQVPDLDALLADEDASGQQQPRGRQLTDSFPSGAANETQLLHCSAAVLVSEGQGLIGSGNAVAVAVAASQVPHSAEQAPDSWYGGSSDAELVCYLVAWLSYALPVLGLHLDPAAVAGWIGRCDSSYAG